MLVFLDADTEPQPAFLGQLLGAQQQWGGLVSVQPYHRTEQPYEQLSVLFNLVGLMAVPLGPGAGVAFGPAMATSRLHYEPIGGHAAVADETALQRTRSAQTLMAARPQRQVNASRARRMQKTAPGRAHRAAHGTPGQQLQSGQVRVRARPTVLKTW